MALNPHFKLTWRNAALDTLTASLGTSCLFRIYAGVQPADVSSALTAANTVLASLTFPSTNAFGAASAGVITANTITSDTSAASGTATFFSILSSAAVRFIDGSVGTSGADLNLNAVTIATGATVAVSAFTVTLPA